MKRLVLLLFNGLFFAATAAFSQASDPINPVLLDDYWPAHWIVHPVASPNDYGVFHFRKEFEVTERLEKFVVHVSGDNRYELYINGEWVSEGPASSDLQHWSFETVDLAPHLRPGRNVLAAQVWNGGELRPMAWMTHRTAFIVQGNTEIEHVVNTDASWHVMKNKAYNPIIFLQNDPKLLWEYYVAGALDSLRAEAYPWDWEQPGFDDKEWLTARPLVRGAPLGKESHQRWYLTPRRVPFLSRQPQRFSRVARNEEATVPKDFLEGHPSVVPPHSRSVLLIDNGELTTGFPLLETTGGQGSRIKLIYAEALHLADQLAAGRKVKGHRNETENREIMGIYDVFLPDGKENRIFRPLNPRTFRWIQLEIETVEEPLILEDFSSIYSVYPSHLEANFSSDNDRLNRIWEAGWRTQELSVQETFVSDLYWERMQYIGDTKVQALTWMYMSSDDRLVRLALEQFDFSRAYFGLTQSRYPAWLEQYIPLYSLVWVGMVHDYWMHRTDDEFVRQFLPGITQVLGWFDRQLNEENILGPLPHFDYIDWGYSGRRNEILEDADNKSMAVHSLFYAWALDQAADLFEQFGSEYKTIKYRRQANELKETVFDRFYDTERGLFADSPSKQLFSMQANVIAILADAITEDKQTDLVKRMLAVPDILPLEMYFEFYMGRALNKAGLGDLYLKRLEPWEEMLAEGMGTFGEIKQNPRSECHAWSASPSYEFLATVAGIEPAEPGFKSVRIAPSLGNLASIEAVVPHPLGLISVDLAREGSDGIFANIVLPEGLTGTFIWNGQAIDLYSGEQSIHL